MCQGSKKVWSSGPRQVVFLARQITFKAYLPMGKGTCKSSSKKIITTLFTISQTLKFGSCLHNFIFAAVNHNNYDHKQRTLKYRNTQTDRNPPITNHKTWPFEPVKVKFCLLRGLQWWLMAAKMQMLGGFLTSELCVFLKSSVTKMSKKWLWPASKMWELLKCPKDKLELKIFFNPVFYNWVAELRLKSFISYSYAFPVTKTLL